MKGGFSFFQLLLFQALFNNCFGGYLRIVLKPHEVHCNYVEAHKGAMIDIKVAITSGYRGDVAARVFVPEKNPQKGKKGKRPDVLMEKENFLQFDISKEAPVSGDYAVCMYNMKQLEETIVDFDYREHLTKLKESVTKKVRDMYDERLQKFVMAFGKMDRSDYHMQKLVDAHKDLELFEQSLNKSLPVPRKSLFLIEARLENLVWYLDFKRSEARHDSWLMENNLWRVDTFSLIFCLSIMMIAYLQVVVVRSLFMNKASFNIWKNVTVQQSY